jgi:hypothetical protein
LPEKSGYGSVSIHLLRSRRQPEQSAGRGIVLAAILQLPHRAVGALFDFAQAASKVETLLFADRAEGECATKGDADPRTGGQTCDQGRAAPFRKQVAGIEDQAGGRDDGVPVLLGRTEVRACVVAGDVPTAVLVTVGNQRPAVICALLDLLELVATPGPTCCLAVNARVSDLAWARNVPTIACAVRVSTKGAHSRPSTCWSISQEVFDQNRRSDRRRGEDESSITYGDDVLLAMAGGGPTATYSESVVTQPSGALRLQVA